MKKNKLVGLLVLLFLFFLLVLIFSIWLFGRAKSSLNNLEISYNYESKSMYGLYPMKDEDGVKTKPYIFKIVNKSFVNSKYNLVIKDVTDGHTDDQLLKRSQINYQLKKNNKVVSSGNLNDIKNNILVIDNISGSNTNTYELRIWLDNDCIETDWMGKYYNYNVSVKSIK